MTDSSPTLERPPRYALPCCDGFQAAIFDLDGVLVDTAMCHYRAWQRLVRKLGSGFPESAIETLQGVSRQASLEIPLRHGNLMLGAAGKQILAGRKNHWYQELPGELDARIDGTKNFSLRAELQELPRGCAEIRCATRHLSIAIS